MSEHGDDGRSREPQVVVGVDGSPGARAALRFALEDAVRRGVPVDAVTAHRPPDYWMDHYLTGENASEVVRDGPQPPPEVRTRGVAGAAADVLVRESAGADLQHAAGIGEHAVGSARAVPGDRRPGGVARPPAPAAPGAGRVPGAGLTAGVTVRVAGPDDAAAVARVHARAGRAAWSAFLGDVLAEPDEAAWRARVREPGFLVAERDGVVVGFARADERCGEVTYLYVDPAEQGRGTGRLLLGLVLDRLRAAGHRRARLRTEQRNTGPRRFYEAAGWRPTGDVLERDWQGHRLREVWYVLDLG